MSPNALPGANLVNNLEQAAALTLASFGKLAGCSSLAETVSHASIRQLVADMLEREIMPGMDIDETIRKSLAGEILARLSDAKEPIEFYAANASTFLSETLLEPVRARLKNGEPAIRLALAIAGWIEFAGGEDDDGEEYEYEDPLIGRLLFLSQQARTNPEALASAFLGLDEIFGDDLPNAALFRQQIVTHLGQLLHQGVLPTIEAVLNGPESDSASLSLQGSA